MPPPWFALLFVAFDYGVLAFWFRYANTSGEVQFIASELLKFTLRLALVTGTLWLASKHCRVSGQALGIRPSNIKSDLRRSLGTCGLGATVAAVAIVAAFSAAVQLGIPLPAPLEIATQFLGGERSFQYFILLGVCGVAGNVIVAVTEELIYRSLFLPALTSRLGLFPAVAVTAIVFGLAHVVPFRFLAIPLLQIIGGILFAAGFSVRWSVVPAIVIHATGNVFVGAILFAYVRLFETHLAWFQAR